MLKSNALQDSQRKLIRWVVHIQQLISVSYELQYAVDHKGRNAAGMLCATKHYAQQMLHL